MTDAEDVENISSRIPILDALGLRTRLDRVASEDHQQIHLVGSISNWSDDQAWEYLIERYGESLDRNTVFRITEGPDLNSWDETVSLNALSLVACLSKNAHYQFLAKLPRLNSLVLGNNKIGTEGAQALAVALPQVTQLRLLELGGNNIDDAGIQALAIALPQLTKLSALHLGVNPIRDEGTQAFAIALPQLTQLSTLDFRCNFIGDKGAHALAVALPKLTRLSALDLGYNSIGDEGAHALAVALPKLTQLSALNLGYNSIGDKGTQAIAVALPRLTQLNSLKFSGNNIGSEGAQALAVALPQLTLLNSLNLVDNNIGSEGAQALAAVLPQLTHLNALNLKHNKIGDKGVQWLAEAYQASGFPQLSSIDLRDNVIECVEETLLETRDAKQIFEAVLHGAALPHARVMLVGMGCMGKTWLRRKCFMDDPVSPDEARIVTKNIDFLQAEKCTVPLGNYTESGKDEIETTVWDFGGQAVKHGVHEGFYTDADERTVYLLVVSARRVPGNGTGDTDETTGNRVMYWLRTLAHFVGPKSPVVIAITQCDDHNLKQDGLETGWQERCRPIDERVLWQEGMELIRLKDVSLELLKQAFGVNVVGIVDHCKATNPNVDGKNVDENIEELRRAVARAIEHHTKVLTAKVPPKYPTFAARVERDFAKPTWTKLEDFKAWCQREDVRVTNPATQETFLQLLNAHGRLFYFGRPANPDDDSDKWPAGQQRRLRWKDEYRAGRQLETAVIHPGWMKQCVYQIVDRTPELAWFDFARDIQPLIELATREVRAVRQSEVDDELILEFLRRSELCWYADDRLKYLFPRGLRLATPRDWHQWSTWPSAHLKWEFLPEANFFRLMVALHKTVIAGKRCVVILESQYQHGRNWVHIRDLKGGGAEAVVLAFPDYGQIDIRFDPAKPGNAEERRWILTKVQHLIEEIQGLPAKSTPDDPMCWKGTLIVDPNPSVSPDPEVVRRFHEIGLLLRQPGEKNPKSIALILKAHPETVKRRIEKMSKHLNEVFPSSRPISELVSVGFDELTPTGEEAMNWGEEWFPSLRERQNKS